jgi:hypothetical protein
MVEEAAEILEAHVLTSLSPRTKHLIMIGEFVLHRPCKSSRAQARPCSCLLLPGL